MDKDSAEKILVDFLLAEPLNRRTDAEGEYLLYDRAVTGVARADDALFNGLRAEAAAGPQFIMPAEWLPGAKSVLCVFFSASEHVRRSNHRPGRVSEPWSHARDIGGNMVIPKALAALVAHLRKMGIGAVAPSLDSRHVVNGFRSGWSERHVAFVAGLGTFGLSRSLITRLGSAGRLGSVVLGAAWEATPRPYTGLYDYCSRCLACVGRCPAKAIGAEGKEHPPCKALLDRGRAATPPTHGCGKCQTRVPCESRPAAMV